MTTRSTPAPLSMVPPPSSLHNMVASSASPASPRSMVPPPSSLDNMVASSASPASLTSGSPSLRPPGWDFPAKTIKELREILGIIPVPTRTYTFNSTNFNSVAKMALQTNTDISKALETIFSLLQARDFLLEREQGVASGRLELINALTSLENDFKKIEEEGGDDFVFNNAQGGYKKRGRNTNRRKRGGRK